jgi:hypothetical protein
VVDEQPGGAGISPITDDTMPKDPKSAGATPASNGTNSPTEIADTSVPPTPTSDSATSQTSATTSDPISDPTPTPDPTPTHLPLAVAQPFIEAPIHPTVAPAEKFAVDEVIGFAWKSMRKYFWPLTGILTCNFLVQTIPGVASMVLNYTSSSSAMSILGLIISLGSMVLNLIIALGTINLWLKVTDGDTIATRDIYAKIPKVWDYTLATIMYGLMVGLGYICLILPGIYLQIRFQFYPYFIVESNASPIDSLKASFAITKGAVAELLFLGIANYFIGWVGLMLFLIGTFPALCIQNIGLARTYRLLRKNTPVSELPPNLLPVPLITDSDTPVIVQA